MQPNFVRIGKGFTILELMIVVAIAGILLALAVPSYQKSAVKAREAALKQNLFTIRNVIDQFYAYTRGLVQSLTLVFVFPCARKPKGAVGSLTTIQAKKRMEQI